MTYVSYPFDDEGPVIGYLVYEGENTTPGATAVGDPVTARTAFMQRLNPGVDVEDFEGWSVGTQFLNVARALNGLNLTITRPGYGAATNFYVNNGSTSGRFNTTPSGSHFLEACGADPLSPAVLSFSSPIAFFGCYFTDLGDFSGQLTIELTKVDASTVTIDINHTLGAPDGSLYFWGFVDDLDTYTQIRIITDSDEDFFGIDDLCYGPALLIA